MERRKRRQFTASRTAGSFSTSISSPPRNLLKLDTWRRILQAPEMLDLARAAAAKGDRAAAKALREVSAK